jgi:hypothetical protein
MFLRVTIPPSPVGGLRRIFNFHLPGTWRQQAPPKRQYTFMKLNDITSQNIVTDFYSYFNSAISLVGCYLKSLELIPNFYYSAPPVDFIALLSVLMFRNHALQNGSSQYFHFIILSSSLFPPATRIQFIAPSLFSSPSLSTIHSSGITPLHFFWLLWAENSLRFRLYLFCGCQCFVFCVVGYKCYFYVYLFVLQNDLCIFPLSNCQLLLYRIS